MPSSSVNFVNWETIRTVCMNIFNTAGSPRRGHRRAASCTAVCGISYDECLCRIWSRNAMTAWKHYHSLLPMKLGRVRMMANKRWTTKGDCIKCPFYTSNLKVVPLGQLPVQWIGSLIKWTDTRKECPVFPESCACFTSAPQTAIIVNLSWPLEYEGKIKLTVIFVPFDEI